MAIEQTIQDVIYLIRCALNQEMADPKEIHSDFKTIYQLAKKHSLASLCSFAVSDVEIGSEVKKLFLEERNKTILRSVQFDMELSALAEFCEAEGIEYLPLKGILIRKLYPKTAMRQMADFDLWYDVKHREKIIDWFVERGYTAEVEVGNHDVFQRPPVLNFEMHTSLYGLSHKKSWRDYYDEKVKHLLPVEGKKWERRFSDEDFYVYILSHAHKHLYGSGTGLRTLVDTFILQKHFYGKLDRSYVEKELSFLGIAEFERQMMSLSKKLFSSGEPLGEEEASLLDLVMGSGTYGNMENRVVNRLTDGRSGKVTVGKQLLYILRRIFPPTYVIRQNYGVKHTWQLPFGYAYRIVYRVATKWKVLLRELKLVFKGDRSS